MSTDKLPEPVAWRLRIGSSNLWSYADDATDADFWGRQSGQHYVKEPLHTAEQLHAALAEKAREIEALRAELDMRRKSGSASDRLHNLCEGIAKDADGSEWSREEWERLDADMLAMKKANADLTVERDALRADVERWQRVDPHGHVRYWIENRGAILDCLTRHGYELLSSSAGWTLHKLPAAIDAAKKPAS